MDEKRLRELSGLLNESAKEETLSEAKGEVHFDNFLVNVDAPAADRIAKFLGIKSKADVAQKLGKGHVNYNAGDRMQFGARAGDILPEGIEEDKTLTESIATWRNPGKGPNLTISISDFADAAVAEVSFSSGKVIRAIPFSPTGSRDDDRKAQQKVLDKKLKEIVKLSQQYERDIEGILKKK